MCKGSESLWLADHKDHVVLVKRQRRSVRLAGSSTTVLKCVGQTHNVQTDQESPPQGVHQQARRRPPGPIRQPCHHYTRATRTRPTESGPEAGEDGDSTGALDSFFRNLPDDLLRLPVLVGIYWPTTGARSYSSTGLGFGPFVGLGALDTEGAQNPGGLVNLAVC